MSGLRFILLFVLTAVTAARAQVSTAEIGGGGTDPSGAAIAGARVAVADLDRGSTRETTTDSTGAYTITLLPPGDYQLSVEAPGFRKAVRDGVTLQVNQRARIDAALEVGLVSETVQVQGTAPLLESQSSSLGNVISEQFVNQLPLNGRNFVQLAILSPGVNGVGYSVAGTIMSGTRPDDRRPGSEIFSNGNREGSNNFLYDGIDNNDRMTLSIVLRPAVEAVREFKVQISMYSAEMGRNSGAQVDVVTRSGTNEIHGSLFEFFRNSAMDARSFFNTVGTPFPPFRFNQFGFSLGGPLTLPKMYNGRNRTFFFVDYEGYRRTLLTSSQATVPTMQVRQGNFAAENRIFDPLTTVQTGAASFTRMQFPGNVMPASRFDPVTAKLTVAYPDPQSADRTNNYLVNARQQQNWDQGDVRIDHQISPSDTLFGRWSIQHTSTISPATFPDREVAGLPTRVGLGNDASFAGVAFQPVQHAVASWIHIFSPRIINEAKVGFNRFVMDYIAEGHEPGLNLGNQLGVPNANTSELQTTVPIFLPANFAGIGAPRTSPIWLRINTFQYLDNLTFTSGKHTWKFGADVRRRQVSDFGVNRGSGRFAFNPAFTNLPGTGGTGHSMASFLLGYANSIEKDWLLAVTGTRGIETGLYFADDWRATRNLTFNLGLRWEYYSPYVEVADRWAFFNADTAVVDIAGQNGVDRHVGIRKNYRDFAPRFGFAYSLNQKTVIRGGYGLFYNPGGQKNAFLRGHRHLPYGPIYVVQPGDFFVGPRVNDGFPAEPALDLGLARRPTGNVIGVFPGFRSSYAQQFNLNVEREISSWQTLIKLAYVGNLGRRLSNNLNINQPVPGPTSLASRRPYFAAQPGLADVTYALSDGLSHYHALQLTVEKRMSRGLGVLTSYTWGHAIENVGTDYGGGFTPPQDIRDRNADRSHANFDIRHRLTVAYLYSFPFGKGQRYLNGGGVQNLVFGGWQTNGIATMQTGLPFTPSLQTPTTNGIASRPDRSGDGNLPSDQRTLDRWFDPAAFPRPAQFTFGNAGRNVLWGPGRVNFDMSLFKEFAITERAKVQFRAEAFNVFNTPQFAQPNASIGSPNAGVISDIVGNPRQLQLALRVEF